MVAVRSPAESWLRTAGAIDLTVIRGLSSGSNQSFSPSAVVPCGICSTRKVHGRNVSIVPIVTRSPPRATPRVMPLRPQVPLELIHHVLPTDFYLPASSKKLDRGRKSPSTCTCCTAVSAWSRLAGTYHQLRWLHCCMRLEDGG